MGKNFRETLTERLKDPAFLAEWDAQEPERQIMRAIAEGREDAGLTQAQLEQALRFASRAAALTCSRPGAIPAMPTLAEVLNETI